MVKKISLLVLTILILLGSFVLADVTIIMNSGSFSPDTPLYIGNPIYPNGTFLNFTITTGTNANFTINMTNFTLSAGLIFNYSTEGSDAYGNFSNLTSGLLLTWQNQSSGATSFGLIPNGTSKSFWFNVSGKDGVYNITITTMDRLGVLNRTSFNITIDKINPNVLYPYNSTIAEKNNYTGLLYYGVSSPWIFLNATINDTNLVNVTFNLYNASNNALLRSNTSTITRTASGMVNMGFNWTGVAEGRYWFNVLVTDSAARTLNTSSSAGNITIDITPPATTITDSGIKNLNLTGATAIAGVYNATSGTLTLNVTLLDNLFNISTSRTVFNVTNTSITNGNSSGNNYSTTFIAVRGTGSTDNFYNSSLNISLLDEGTYTITIIANDSIGNLNTSESTILKVDRTRPSVIASSGSVAQTIINITISANDSVSGIKNCSSTGGTIAGSSSIYISGLTCATTYTYNVSCYDQVGYMNSSEVSITTSACSTSSSSGGSASSTWYGTFYPIDSEFAEGGYTKEIASKFRIRVKIGTTDHFVGVTSLTSTQATFEISSTPQQAVLTIGQEKKFEVTNDSYYDLSVKLNSIANNKANVTIKKINELMPVTIAEDNVATTTGDATGDATGEAVGSKSGKLILWIIIIIVILVGIVFGIRYYNLKRPNSNYKGSFKK